MIKTTEAYIPAFTFRDNPHISVPQTGLELKMLIATILAQRIIRQQIQFSLLFMLSANNGQYRMPPVQKGYPNCYTDEQIRRFSHVQHSRFEKEPSSYSEQTYTRPQTESKPFYSSNPEPKTSKPEAERPVRSSTPQVTPETISFMKKTNKDMNPEDGNPYSFLGLTPGSSEAEVKKAYKKQALAFHPDKNTDPQAAEAFKTVRNNYEAIAEEQGFNP